MNNIILQTDGYKVSHHSLLPPKTSMIYSYLEARKADIPNVCFFGLQYILEKYLTGKVVTLDKINQAERHFNQYFGNSKVFNKAGWEYILKKYNGYLPLSIRAVPEGTIVPHGNVLMTIFNTDNNCAWLTNYVETLLLHVWAPTTVASRSLESKMILKNHLLATGTSETLEYKLHDFGYRGVSSYETAALCGAAHLIHFQGSDTLAANELIEDYYGYSNYPSCSIPASEHSTITSWGRSRELDAYRNMLEKYPTGIIACVSDSFNIYEACEKLWGTELKDQILNRDGVLVIRPDSGDPLKVLPKLLEILGRQFGFVINSKGFKVLNPKVRLIQGDGIEDHRSIDMILKVFSFLGWSADNISFGSGGGLLQKINRDTMGFAIKCSAAIVDGQLIEVYKSPVDQPDKNSKKGFLKLVKSNGQYQTVSVEDRGYSGTELHRVFENGWMTKTYTFDEVRKNARLS